MAKIWRAILVSTARDSSVDLGLVEGTRPNVERFLDNYIRLTYPGSSAARLKLSPATVTKVEAPEIEEIEALFAEMRALETRLAEIKDAIEATGRTKFAKLTPGSGAEK